MAEVDLAESSEEALAAAEWLKARLAEMGAAAGGGLSGLAGSVDATMHAFMLPDGKTVEVWSDDYTPLSLRGDDGLIGSLVADYREALDRG